MRLTKQKAIAICIELWEWLAETGKEKHYWPGWKQYGMMVAHCPFCKYVRQTHSGCEKCPYSNKFGWCALPNSPYERWTNVIRKSSRQKYANQFLEQLKQL